MKIEDEWNKIAKKRLEDRLSGNDTSYNTVLLPLIINRVRDLKQSINSILDFGCGTGEMTFEISKLNIKTVGVDISKHSISIANDFFNHEYLSFIGAPLSETLFEEKFDLIIASMSLMDAEDADSCIKDICKNLKDNGILLITITHPSFWPLYWGYYNETNFDYLSEKKITRTYKTSNKIFWGFETSHYHRPISFYFQLFKSNRLILKDMQELGNPNDAVWYPRFLFFELYKKSETSKGFD